MSTRLKNKELNRQVREPTEPTEPPQITLFSCQGAESSHQVPRQRPTTRAAAGRASVPDLELHY